MKNFDEHKEFEALAKNVRSLRKENYLSQEELAFRADLFKVSQ